MTANQIFAPDSRELPCTHESIIPGLDCLQCRNCRRTWPSWHPDFNRLLNQPQVTPEQSIGCSGVDLVDLRVTPEQSIGCSGVDLVDLRVTPEHNHWIETYSPSNRKNCSYYRYVWMDGQRMHHIHISGGNTGSAIAQSQKTEVERWINLGRSPEQIQDLIKSWRKA